MSTNSIAMTNDLFHIRLREARLLCGLSMDKLAAKTNGAITKQSLSKYEAGVMYPKRGTLAALAKALDIGEAFFSGADLEIDTPMLRRTSGGVLSDVETARLEAILSFWTEQYLAKEKESGMAVRFSNPLSELRITKAEDVAKAALLLREQWNCGDGPLPCILRLLERKGLKVKAMELPDGILGLSTWANNTYPLILVDVRPEKTTVERLRFTVCHELGHLLLDFSGDADEEKLCDRFSGFFLFPQKTFIEEFGNEERECLTLAEMIDLKEIYGVSVAAQVHEAHDLGMITEEHYHWWFEERISKNPREKGWGTYPIPETLGREKRIDSILNNTLTT